MDPWKLLSPSSSSSVGKFYKAKPEAEEAGEAKVEDAKVEVVEGKGAGEVEGGVAVADAENEAEEGCNVE